MLLHLVVHLDRPGVGFVALHLEAALVPTAQGVEELQLLSGQGVGRLVVALFVPGAPDAAPPVLAVDHEDLATVFPRFALLVAGALAGFPAPLGALDQDAVLVHFVVVEAVGSLVTRSDVPLEAFEEIVRLGSGDRSDDPAEFAVDHVEGTTHLLLQPVVEEQGAGVLAGAVAGLARHGRLFVAVDVHVTKRGLGLTAAAQVFAAVVITTTTGVAGSVQGIVQVLEAHAILLGCCC